MAQDFEVVSLDVRRAAAVSMPCANPKCGERINNAGAKRRSRVFHSAECRREAEQEKRRLTALRDQHLRAVEVLTAHLRAYDRSRSAPQVDGAGESPLEVFLRAFADVPADKREGLIQHLASAQALLD